MILKKVFSSRWTHAYFGKTMGNLRKHRNNRLVTTEVRRNCFVSESSYDIKTFFSEYLLAIEIKKTANIHK